MAMIACAECGAKVSTRAGACPSCGNPIAEATRDVKAAGVPVVTTQQTAKKFKKHMLLSVAAFIGSFFWLFNVGMDKNVPGVVGHLGFVILFLGGIVGFFTARIRAWWHHG